jgi:hypothetical protein
MPADLTASRKSATDRIKRSLRIRRKASSPRRRNVNADMSSAVYMPTSEELQSIECESFSVSLNRLVPLIINGVATTPSFYRVVAHALRRVFYKEGGENNENRNIIFSWHAFDRLVGSH